MNDSAERYQASLSQDGRYRLLIEAITDYAIYMVDPSGIVTSWNPGARRFKGYEAHEIIGKSFAAFYTPEDQKAGKPRLALQTAAREGKFEGEGWRVRKDGRRFWAHVVIDPILAVDGTLLGFAKITRDLTERKDHEQSLRQFELLVQNVTDYAIYMLDAQGNVVTWNQGAQRIKGYRPDEIVGRHFSLFYTDEDRADGEPKRALAAASAEGRYEKEGWRVRKSGEKFAAHVIIDPIRDDKGQLVGYAKVTRDITERRNAATRYEEAQQALVQAQKVEALGQLTGGIAHDFNNLLMAVMGSLELLRKRMPADPQLHRLVDNAFQGAERGAALTQRMLAFARHQEVEMTAIDLRSLLEDMRPLLQSSLGPRIVTNIVVPAALPHVLADRNQLELAVLNVCMNARDAMHEEGTIKIAVSSEAAPHHALLLKPGSYVCIAITDTGEGMDSGTLARAIEPFFTTKVIGKGTGLGLSMVHGMAEQMGGRLTLRSVKGMGTTAAIWLQAAGEDQAQVPQGKALQEGATRALTVLVVDDEPLVLFNTRAMIEELGHRVLEAYSASGALELLQSNDVDLVITDQGMPQMSGLELIAEIKARGLNPKFIIATGYAEIPGAAKNIERLGKPFSERELAAAIARVMAS